MMRASTLKSELARHFIVVVSASLALLVLLAAVVYTQAQRNAQRQAIGIATQYYTSRFRELDQSWLNLADALRRQIEFGRFMEDNRFHALLPSFLASFGGQSSASSARQRARRDLQRHRPYHLPQLCDAIVGERREKLPPLSLYATGSGIIEQHLLPAYSSDTNMGSHSGHRKAGLWNCRPAIHAGRQRARSDRQRGFFPAADAERNHRHHSCWGLAYPHSGHLCAQPLGQRLTPAPEPINTRMHAVSHQPSGRENTA